MSEELKNEVEAVEYVEETKSTETSETEKSESGDIIKNDNKEHNRSGYEIRKKVNIDELVEKKVQEQLKSFKEQARGSQEESLIKAVAVSEDEATAIKFHLENSVKRTEDISADIENAKLLANKEKIFSLSKEMPAILSAARAGVRASGEKYSTDAGPAAQYSDKEVSFLNRFGVNPNTGKIDSK